LTLVKRLVRFGCWIRGDDTEGTVFRHDCGRATRERVEVDGRSEEAGGFLPFPDAATKRDH
jgi:DNA-binding sugar fermentation-stimulating protein